MLPIGLVFCLPPWYNFIFTIDYRFSIGFRSRLYGGHSIISSINFLCSKNSQISSDTWEGALSCINTHFISKLCEWNLYPTKSLSSLKMQSLRLFSLIPSLTLNGLIIAWLTIPAHIITLPPPCCLLLAIGTFEWDKIHFWVHPSSPSNITQDSFCENLLGHFVLLDSLNSSFFKDLSDSQKQLFCYNLLWFMFLSRKFLKPFPLLQVIFTWIFFPGWKWMCLNLINISSELFELLKFIWFA